MAPKTPFVQPTLKVKKLTVIVELEDGRILDAIDPDIVVRELNYSVNYGIHKSYDGYAVDIERTGEVDFSLTMRGCLPRKL